MTVLQHPGRTPQSIAGEESHQIKQMYPENNQVLSSRAAILFPMSPDL
jgi:hypothetical protein